ncbi:sigma 54-interacting transcriptional regulator, partial [Acinetobacter baumannii]
MNASTRTPDRLLTLPRSPNLATSIRATAQVFEDPKSQALLEHLRQVAPSEASVLVIGETGTGKELVARHIHNLSARRNGPFVAVNCGAFSESLVEAELFGHEKGAFTGALAAKAGWFEEANGGTLFLDEIGELGADEQAMLLKAIEEKRFFPLGSDREVESDFQLIAGTHRDLRGRVAEGLFREDLFARINLWTFELPGLAGRREDIEPNIDFELERHAREQGRQVRFNLEAKRRYLAFAGSSEARWAGNLETNVSQQLLRQMSSELGSS